MRRQRVELIPKLVCGSYKVGERLGGGSFGEIYKATNVTTGQEVAIKFVLLYRKIGINIGTL